MTRGPGQLLLLLLCPRLLHFCFSPYTSPSKVHCPSVAENELFRHSQHSLRLYFPRKVILFPRPPPPGVNQKWVSPFLDQATPSGSISDLAAEASRKRSNSIGSENSSASSSTTSTSKKLSAEYLTELEDDLLKLTLLPIPAPQSTLMILRKEITRVRGILNQNEFAGCSQMDLPAPEGPIIKVSKKFYVPVRDYPTYNFVGRILGPRGMTVRQFEQETGCRLLLRGKGSKNGKVRVTSGDDLHVLVICEDTKNRVTAKLQKAIEHVMKLLIPGPEDQEIRKNQLAKLALLNGNYNPSYNSTLF